MKSIYSGLAIGLSCWIYLSIQDKVLGALLFSCGLLAVRLYELNLFTGKCQYIFTFKYSWKYYVGILFGNLLGICIMAGLATQNIHTAAANIAATKATQTFIEAILKGIGCGALMSLATFKKTPLWISAFCVLAFILSGFNHCIADAFYMIAGGQIHYSWFGTLLGDIFGGALFTTFFKDEQ